MSDTTQSDQRKTSERHSAMLDGYHQGGTKFNAWVEDHLGGLALERWEYGAVELRWTFDQHQIMPDGVLFGGHIAAVADHIAALATMSALTQDEERFRTSRLETDFFRPLMGEGADVRAIVTNASRRLIHVTGEVFDKEGRLAVQFRALQARTRSGPQ